MLSVVTSIYLYCHVNINILCEVWVRRLCLTHNSARPKYWAVFYAYSWCVGRTPLKKIEGELGASTHRVEDREQAAFISPVH